MVQAYDITRTPSPGKNRLDGIVRSAFGEVAEERIACPEGKKAQRGATFRGSSGKKAVHDFEARAIATDSNEIAIAFCIGAVRNHGGFAGNARFMHFDRNTRR